VAGVKGAIYGDEFLIPNEPNRREVCVSEEGAEFVGRSTFGGDADGIRFAPHLASLPTEAHALEIVAEDVVGTPVVTQILPVDSILEDYGHW